MREMPLAIREYVDSLSPEAEDRVLGERLVVGYTYPTYLGENLGMSDRCLIGAGENFKNQEDFVSRAKSLGEGESGKLVAVGLAFDRWASPWMGGIGLNEAGAQIRQRILNNRLARSLQPAAAAMVSP
jgi:hypothetical protein